MTLTINIRSKKAMKILQSLENTRLIDIIEEKGPLHWSAKNKKEESSF